MRSCSAVRGPASLRGARAAAGDRHPACGWRCVGAETPGDAGAGAFGLEERAGLGGAGLWGLAVGVGLLELRV